MSIELLPAEKLALTAGLSQVRRGDELMTNIATMCILALARLDGRYDWTKAGEQPVPNREKQ